MLLMIDVLELDKANEFSVGRQLRVGRKYTYSDLDELIVSHIKSMARKVDEMTTHEKFQRGSRADTGKHLLPARLIAEQWLTSYSEANPRRSAYAFCVDKEHPGCFDLCFKTSPNAPVKSWVRGLEAIANNSPSKLCLVRSC
jgi:transcription elongation factor SPT6